MNRKVKNVVMIVVLLVVCILSYFTMNAAVKNSMPDNGKSGKEIEGTAPNFDSGETSEEDIPQKPSGDSENRKKPSRGDKTDNPENEEITSDGEITENLENSENSNKENMPEDYEKNLKSGNFSKKQSKQNISAIYYILFAVEGLIISSLLIYLIMSKFNSKTLKETLGTGKNIIIFVILVVIITIGLTLGQSILAKNVFASNNTTQFENRQRPRSNTNNSKDTNETTDIENSDDTNQTENI